ncbi:MAG TPA: YihY/virulence factor BrkB family protein [Acidimicrobiales bacterium]|nr:YihY/virulence factor BrkB family protein [Acidimicrobiales bacterium]
MAKKGTQGTKGTKKDKQPRGGLDEVLGVGVATVALIAGGAAAASRSVRTRRNGGEPPADTAPVVPIRPATTPPPSGIKAKLTSLGDRFKPLGFLLRVQDRYGDLHGNNLAAAVTFQAFVSLFPLLLVAVAIIGWLSGDGTNIAGSVVRELGLTGDARDAVVDAVEAARESKRAASVIGLVSMFWSGLGLVNALQYGYNQVWQVEERGLRDKAIGILWLGGAVVVFVAAAAITTVLRWLPGYFAPLGIVLALLVNFGLWVWTSKILPNTRLPWRAVLPGALFAAIGLEVLKAVGAFFVPKMVASSSQLYGTLGVVFALLAWLFFFGRLIIYSAVVNVVRWENEAGTVTVVTEVPVQPGADPGEQVSRMGRLEAHKTA